MDGNIFNSGTKYLSGVWILILIWSSIPEFDEECKLCTRLYDKRDDFDVPIVNFSYLRGIIRNPLQMFVHSWYGILGFV